jgi:hypothetical protein
MRFSGAVPGGMQGRKDAKTRRRAVSSAGERRVDIAKVSGSIPLPPTISVRGSLFGDFFMRPPEGPATGRGRGVEQVLSSPPRQAQTEEGAKEDVADRDPGLWPYRRLVTPVQVKARVLQIAQDTARVGVELRSDIVEEDIVLLEDYAFLAYGIPSENTKAGNQTPDTGIRLEPRAQLLLTHYHPRRARRSERDPPHQKRVESQQHVSNVHRRRL